MSRIVMILLVVVGCATDRGPELTTTGEVSPAAAHAVSGAALRRTMARLDRVRPERMPQELSSMAAEHEQLAAIGAAAGEMAKAADAIPDAIEDVRLAPSDRAHFLDLAATLRSEGLAIEAAAARGDAAAVRRRVSEVEVTCNQCHTAFRVLPIAGH